MAAVWVILVILGKTRYPGERGLVDVAGRDPGAGLVQAQRGVGLEAAGRPGDDDL